jgi:histone deacetylase complex regulatory component SIN3
MASPEDLAAQLATLDEQPVQAHPDLLERLHRAIEDELDALAATAQPIAQPVAEPVTLPPVG